MSFTSIAVKAAVTGLAVVFVITFLICISFLVSMIYCCYSNKRQRGEENAPLTKQKKPVEGNPDN